MEHGIFSTPLKKGLYCPLTMAHSSLTTDYEQEGIGLLSLFGDLHHLRLLVSSQLILHITLQLPTQSHYFPHFPPHTHTHNKLLICIKACRTYVAYVYAYVYCLYLLLPVLCAVYMERVGMGVMNWVDQSFTSPSYFCFNVYLFSFISVHAVT